MDKCLEFTLPSGAGGMAAGMTRQSIGSKLRHLLETNKIGHYKTQTVRYRYRVWFENEIDFTTFFLVWEPSNSWHKPIVVYESYQEDPRKNTQDSRKQKT